MPRYTLLDMVQTIMSDMNEDLVNSIDDTQTADQVARIVRDTYYDMLNARLWPTTAKLSTLTPSADNNYPTHVKIPDNVYRLEKIRYNVKDQISNADGLDEYKEIQWLSPDDFMTIVLQRNPANSDITTVLDNLSNTGVKLFIENDKDPQYWTSFDDEWVVFDSYDISFDDTIQSQKIMASVYIEPGWTQADTFIPDLPTKAFPLLLSESKKAAFVKVKQSQDPIEIERSRKQRTWMAGEKHRTRDKGINYPDYGRS